MAAPLRVCPDCQSGFDDISRRQFLQTTAGAVAVASVSRLALAAEAEPAQAAAKAAAPTAESYVKQLYDSLDERQRNAVCFAWDYVDPQRGLLRTHVSNNWHITRHAIGGGFYNKDQQELIRAIFENIYSPDWVAQIDKQLQDDAGGYGRSQNIAIFGQPGEGKFELVMTGRHLTVRCDGNSAEHVAFGGPIFYGHAAQGFNEKADHPGNVFWPQALEANKVYEMLDGKQRETALVAERPRESAVAFQGADGKFPGIPIADLSADQKDEVEKVLAKLLEPYRAGDRSEALECLKAQGGLEACSLGFYKDGDIGSDRVWDNWRIEGPSFVWYFRGEPHVHVWVNIASDPGVKLNARG